MTVQSTYPAAMRPGLPGQLADCTVKDTISGCALENIPFGCAVVGTVEPDYGYLLPGSRASSIDIVGSFVTGNSIVITLNGSALPAIAYAGSHQATLDAIVAQLRAQSVVENVNVTTEGWITPHTTISVVVNPPATTGVTAMAVTGGATQPTITILQAPYNMFAGVCQKSDLAAPLFPNIGNVQPFQGYVEGQCMNILRDGRIYVQVEEAVTKGSTVYIRVVEGGSGFPRGSFRASADGGNAVAAPLFSYMSNAAAGEVAVVQINP